jgi:hypothetical protein
VRSILVGDLQMSFNDADGARVERAGPRPSAEARLRPRFRPRRTVEVPPGRAAEIERALGGLRSGDPVEFHAPCGFGKSTLLQCIAARAEAELGVPAIYLQTSTKEDVEDVLQRLVWKLYTPERPAKLTAEGCAELLRRARAVVVLDDVSFSPPDVARLIRLLSGCGVVLGSTRPVIGRHGTSWMLPGLSDEVAIDMVGNVLGRTLTGDERAALIRLAEAIEGRPLHLRQERGPSRSQQVSAIRHQPGGVSRERSCCGHPTRPSIDTVTECEATKAVGRWPSCRGDSGGSGGSPSSA